MLTTVTANGVAPLLDLGAPKGGNGPGDGGSFSDALDARMRQSDTPKAAKSTAHHPQQDSSGRVSKQESSRSDKGQAAVAASDDGRVAAEQPEKAPLQTDDESCASEAALNAADANETKQTVLPELPAEFVAEAPPLAASGEGDVLPAGNELPADTAVPIADADVVERATGAVPQAADKAIEALRRQIEAGRPGAEVRAEHSTGLPRQLADTDARIEQPTTPTVNGTAPNSEADSSKFLELLAAGRTALTSRTPVDPQAPAQLPPEIRHVDGLSGSPQPAATVIAAPSPASTTAQPIPTAAPVNSTVTTPLQQPGWDHAFAERVTWMVRQNSQEANIQLNPRHLGPVELKVSLHQDQVQVQFQVHNPLTRDAVESAIPRLREMLAESGLNLAHSSVSDQHPQQGREGQGSQQVGQGAEFSGSNADSKVDEETVISQISLLNGRTGVDYFA